MNRIAANLTPLLMSPAFLLWHLIGAAICIPAIVYAGTAADVEVGGYVAIFVLPAWSACVFTSLQKDLLHKPFTFCLPGHRDVLRRTTFGVGIAASLVAALPVISYPGLGGLSLLWAVWSVFCFAMIVYLIIMVLQMWMDAAGTALAIFMVVGCVFIEFTGARLALQQAAIFAPLLNAGVLVVISMFAWRWLGSVGLARRTCGGRFLSLQMAWRRSAGEQFWLSGRRESLSKGTSATRRWLLRRCFAWISRRPLLSLRRHLTATLYEVSGYLVPLRAWTLPLTVLGVFVLLMVAGYAPPSETGMPAANITYILSCIIGLHLAIPMSSTMLLPAGRRERFLTGLVFAVSGGLVVLANSLLVFSLLRFMGMLAPPLVLGGELYPFRPADLGPALVPLLHLPLSICLKISCKKWLLIPEVLLMIFAGILIIRGSVAFRGLSPYAITIMLSVCWTILVGVLYSYSFRRDLVWE